MTIEAAKEVLRIEEAGIEEVRRNLGGEFLEAVDAILGTNGKVVICGIGKSGLVGQKISATLNSTGTRSTFLHPVEAMHGDLGTVAEDDVVLAISYSGETVELTTLLVAIRERGNTIIAMTGGMDSTLARQADIVLNIHVPEEACPLRLAPTTSTTATLALGDAVAMILINRRHFQAEDFRLNHPGGSLGQRLKVRVTEVMNTGINVPTVGAEASAMDAMLALNDKNLGVVLILSEKREVLGIVTDGDIRRAWVDGAESKDLTQLKARELMTENPVCIDDEHLAADALSIMQRYEITALPIVDSEKRLIGLIHLHNLLGKGEFRFLV
jgi:arabinose-5-phosphate isomerase